MIDHTVCIVKDPFFQQAFDSDRNRPVMLKSAYYSLRVDHPSDIIPLIHGDERIPEKWRSEVHGDDKSSRSTREEGNKSFRTKQWAEAHSSQVTLSRTLETPEDKQLAHINRSITNLKIGRPAKALSDATQVYDPNKPCEKVLFRLANALYTLQKLEQCESMVQTILDAFPSSKMAEAIMQRVKSRLLEQRIGKYKFSIIYKQANSKEGPPFIDCAIFPSPIEIRDSLGHLFDEGYQKVTVSECDGAPVVDSFVVEKVISLNSFGSPTTTRDFCKNIIWSGKVGPSPSCRERPLFTTSGVWLLAARINHSCVCNCRRSFIGDIQIVRAAQDLPVGTELTFPYCPTGDPETYQDIQNKLAKWGFTCDCELCKDRRKTTKAVRVLRKELHDDFMDQSPSDEPFDLDKAMELMKGIEKT
ncbi:hypothetical protein FCULG_00007245 [Fusarium culmorum]|uniref:Uncharacterized protein n=1 Tax=Fusarium culmorum TaxID=5516 RepID=A0A2T4GTV5_FUSCU|nr:hypothetical protein FCULG_00007245 [Fusarium culmorum]